MLEHSGENVAGLARVAAMEACDEGLHRSWSGNVNEFKEKSSSNQCKIDYTDVCRSETANCICFSLGSEFVSAL
jgi:hypothetical protein